MPASDNTPKDPFSRTQRRNDMLELQKLGESLVDLPDIQLERLSLPDDLFNAIQVVRKLKTHESIRRQMQYIGKKMRSVDTEAIRAALKQVEFTNEQRTNAFHIVEDWREKLIAGGDKALQQLLEMHPHADRQHLRQLIRKATQDRANNKKTGGELELFRYLRELLT